MQKNQMTRTQLSKMSKMLILFIAFAASGSITSLLAQVTIGSGESPASGALLQIKENEGTADNSNQGLGMPRVNLTNLTPTTDIELAASIGGGASDSYDLEKHIGLVVYNVHEDLCVPDPIAKGMHVWDGARWQNLSASSVATSAPASVLSVSPISFCESGSGAVSATASPGADIRWYATATGGDILATGPSYTTPSISATTVYYAEAYNAVSGCVSARMAVAATVGATDVDGNTYPVKLFGSQCWMTQNLRTTRDKSGIAMNPKINPGFLTATAAAVDATIAWMTSSDPVAAGFKDMSTATTDISQKDFATKYGALYTQSNALRSCPEGWHLPFQTEWVALTTYLATIGTPSSISWKMTTGAGNYNNRSNEPTSTEWHGYAPSDSNHSGFNAYPSGYVDTDGISALEFGQMDRWWSADSGRFRAVVSFNSNLGSNSNENVNLNLSVRCIKD